MRNHYRRLARSRAGFTLTEMVLIVAVLGALAALALPLLSRSHERSRQSACLANMHAISAALLLYVRDYDEVMPVVNPKIPGIHGGKDHREPYDRQLAAYVKDDRTYTCPDDPALRPGVAVIQPWMGAWDGTYQKKYIPRSYRITDTITTEESASRHENLDKNTGVGGHVMSQLEQPDSTVGLVEDWGTWAGRRDGGDRVGSADGSVLRGCDTADLAGRHKPAVGPVDALAPCQAAYAAPRMLPTRGHFGRGSYAFADGHVQALTWQQVRADDFRNFKLRKPTQSFVP